MPSNILTKTEAFDDTSEWAANDSLIITANSAAAPAFAGPNAGLADTLQDNSAVLQCSLSSAFHVIPDDSTDWIFSLFVAKDAVTDRFPEMWVVLTNGVQVAGGISIQTSDGTVANSFNQPAPLASGMVDVDSLWRRYWLRVRNNSSGNTAAIVFYYPALASSLGGPASSPAVGSTIAWGANLMNASSLQDYQPDPRYSFQTKFVLARP